MNQSFINSGRTFGGLAVDGAHIYWTTPTGTIGRANLDGSGVNPNFVVIPNASGTLNGIAVDSSGIFFTDGNGIGFVNLDGRNISPLVQAVEPFDLALTHQSGLPYLYFTSGASGAIGRAYPMFDPSFIRTNQIGDPSGLAIAGNYLYWAVPRLGTIERAALDYSDTDSPFFVTGGSPWSVAADGSSVYWLDNTTGKIGRANLDGTGVNQSFITAAEAGPNVLAVDAGGPRPALAPQLTEVTQSAASWQLGSAPPLISRAKVPVGTTFGFTLDRPARVWFVFTYRTIGRFVGDACVAQTSANRGGARCLLTVRALFRRQAHAGRNRLHFEGRINRTRKLPPGLYRLIIFATANGHRSKAAILRFTILPTTSRTSPAFTG